MGEGWDGMEGEGKVFREKRSSTKIVLDIAHATQCADEAIPIPVG